MKKKNSNLLFFQVPIPDYLNYCPFFACTLKRKICSGSMYDENFSLSIVGLPKNVMYLSAYFSNFSSQDISLFFVALKETSYTTIGKVGLICKSPHNPQNTFDDAYFDLAKAKK